MERPFQMSAPVIGWVLVLVAAALVVALLVPVVSFALGILGAIAIVAMWLKVAVRTRKWVWWEFDVVPLTHTEGLVAVSGLVLFATMFIAVLASLGHAT